MRKLLQDKKGVLGLNLAKSFIVVLIALAILGTIALIVISQFTSPLFVGSLGITINRAVSNETIGPVNETTLDLAADQTLNSMACTISEVTNFTAGVDINDANYTTTNNGCTFAATNADPFNNTKWNITYTTSHKSDQGVTDVGKNVTEGISTFFENVPTFMSMLAIAVLILIVSIVFVGLRGFNLSSKTDSGL